MGKLIGRLTKSKQEPHEPIPMHGDGAEKAERHGGAMLAAEYHGKLCAVCQQKLGKLRDIVTLSYHSRLLPAVKFTHHLPPAIAITQVTFPDPVR